jgi:hypothetical protein
LENGKIISIQESEETKQVHKEKLIYGENDGNYFVPREMVGLDTFIMETGSESFKPNSKNS